MLFIIVIFIIYIVVCIYGVRWLTGIYEFLHSLLLLFYGLFAKNVFYYDIYNLIFYLSTIFFNINALLAFSSCYFEAIGIHFTGVVNRIISILYFWMNVQFMWIKSKLYAYNPISIWYKACSSGVQSRNLFN